MGADFPSQDSRFFEKIGATSSSFSKSLGPALSFLDFWNSSPNSSPPSPHGMSAPAASLSFFFLMLPIGFLTVGGVLNVGCSSLKETSPTRMFVTLSPFSFLFPVSFPLSGPALITERSFHSDRMGMFSFDLFFSRVQPHLGRTLLRISLLLHVDSPRPAKDGLLFFHSHLFS